MLFFHIKKQQKWKFYEAVLKVGESDPIESVSKLDSVDPLIKIKSMDKIKDMIVSTEHNRIVSRVLV